LRPEVQHEVADSAVLRRQWNELVTQMEPPEVFYTFEWAEAMQASYGSTRKPLLIFASEGGRLVGIAALAADPAARQAEFLAANTADYCDFISRPQDRRALVESVLELLPHLGFDTLVLANLPADSATMNCLKAAARRSGHNLFARAAYSCARLVLGDTAQRAALKQGLAAKKNLRRELNRLREHGEVTLTHLTAWSDLETELPLFSAAHVQRFREAGKQSNLAAEERAAFVAELARRLSGSGWLCLSVLRAGEQRVAWNYGFRFGGSWFYYQPTFAGRFEANSPGLCLLSRMIDGACDDPAVLCLDLGLGPEPYKLRFANATRETLHVTLTTSSARHVKTVARYRAAEIAKRSPRIERFIRTALARSGRSAFPGTNKGKP
jgi:CelD/BcsL family acetyltransferase involved in cellulose biosynthesis